jgi:ubiquinone/menaquinone biosynthesis C-methylase UbiE
MCGIAGFIGAGDLCDLRRMTDALVHRGPDAEGHWVDERLGVHLGHRRLSILDHEGREQPMWNADHSLGIVFNGEIYNHGELRDELVARGHVFRSHHSDTEAFCSADARAQQEHYDRVAAGYLENLCYPHTQEYTAYLDQAFLEMLGEAPLGELAEICCGRGEAFELLAERRPSGIGVDVSLSMLEAAVALQPAGGRALFVQGDATGLPLASEAFDTVVMLSGIHHVGDRDALFSEVARILRPGGRLLWREPVSDFLLWRWLRAVIYRFSPALDHETERPLLRGEVEPPLERAGLQLRN